jgi:hypothetical protein
MMYHNRLMTQKGYETPPECVRNSFTLKMEAADFSEIMVPTTVEGVTSQSVIVNGHSPFVLILS